jgi:hypothetical protein
MSFDRRAVRAGQVHRRSAVDAGDEWFMVGFPDSLTAAQLEELDELARKLRVRIDADLPAVDASLGQG